MLKVCLIGVGGISGAHIPAWNAMEDAELTGLCDIRPERLEKYPDKHGYADFNEMLDKEQPDILDICLPSYLHAEYAIAAMDRGIHVLCEKPISLKREDVARVYEAARRNNVCFMVAHVLRFWPEFEFIKELQDTGKYGKMLSGSMTRVSQIPLWSWDNWMMDKDRSGLVPFDLHIHDLDFLVYAFGKPDSVERSRVKRPEQDSLCEIYKWGDTFVSCESAWYAAPLPFQASFRFQFEKAVVVYYGGKLNVYALGEEATEISGGSDEASGVINLPQTDAYANEINYFADCVRNNRPIEKVREDQMQAVLDIAVSL